MGGGYTEKIKVPLLFSSSMYVVVVVVGVTFLFMYDPGNNGELSYM